MPENGFLQGLFLEEQLRASRKNQEAQINASREAQQSSQDFNREQSAVQQNQFMQQMGMRQRELLAEQQRAEFGQQLQMAGLFGNDVVRRPDASGVAQFLNIGLPPQQAEMQAQPNADPNLPPDISYGAPKFDSTFATAQMPAPEGTLMQIGGQQVLIPSKGQRLEEGFAAKKAEGEADIQQKITAVNKYIALFPEASPTTKDAMRARMLMQFNTHADNTNQGITEANTEMFDAIRRGDEPARKLAEQRRNALVEIQNGFYKTQASGRASANLMNVPMFQATQLLSKIDPQITQVGAQLFPSSKVLSDDQRQQTIAHILDNPELQKRLGIVIPPEQAAFVRMAAQKIRTGFDEDESTTGMPGKIVGARTDNVEKTLPTPLDPIVQIKAKVNAARAAKGLPPLP